MLIILQLPDPATMGILPETMSPPKQNLKNYGGGSPLVKKVMKKSFGTPNKSPMKKANLSNISKSPGKLTPLKNLSKEGGKDTPFSSKVFKEWRNKYASKDESGFHCLVCPKSFTLDSSLKRHYKNVHELVCKCCNMQFAEEHLLKAHHKEKHEYWCTPCNKVFTLRSSLIRHNVQQHGAESPRKQEKVKSEPDNAVFANINGLNSSNIPLVDPNIVIPPVDIDYQGLRHEDIAEDPAEDEDPQTFENVKNEPNYNEDFNNQADNTEYFNASSGVDEENTSNFEDFSECITNDTKHNVTMSPMGSAHNPRKQQQKRGDGEMQCSECDKMFSNKGNMNRHFNSTHVFPCKVCKEKFVEKQLMEAHYFEEHVMHCPVCKKTFSNKGNLNRHMKQAHDEELPKDYIEPNAGKPVKQGTPTKTNQPKIPKLSSPNLAHGNSKIPLMQANQKLPLPHFGPGQPQIPPFSHVQDSSNLRFPQPNVQQQQNFMDSYPQMYRPAAQNKSIAPNWKHEPVLPGNGWQQQM